MIYAVIRAVKDKSSIISFHDFPFFLNVVVYTTHLPAILMQENPSHVTSIPSPSMTTSIFSDKQDMFQHDTIHSIFGEEILASGPFSDEGCSSETGDHSDVEIDI